MNNKIMFGILLLTMLMITGCFGQSNKEQIIQTRTCQLSCLQANMSYQQLQIIDDNKTVTSLQCVCNSYPTINK